MVTYEYDRNKNTPKDITSVKILNGISSIKDYAFKDC